MLTALTMHMGRNIARLFLSVMSDLVLYFILYQLRGYKASNRLTFPSRSLKIAKMIPMLHKLGEIPPGGYFRACWPQNLPPYWPNENPG